MKNFKTICKKILHRNPISLIKEIYNRLKFYYFIYYLDKYPKSLHIETTTYCNFDCEFCVLKSNMKIKETMSFENFVKLKPYIKKAKKISLSGLAEPLMNKQIVEFIKFIKENNKNSIVSIVTNASLLTEKLSTQLIEAKLDYLEFSIEAADISLNDNIRMGSDQQKIIDNIKQLIIQKKVLRSNLPHISATVVLQTKNYKELKNVFTLLSEIGVSNVAVNGLEPYTASIKNNILWKKNESANDLENQLKIAYKEARNLGINVTTTYFEPQNPSCKYVRTPFILPNGDLTMCAVLAYQRSSFYRIDEKLNIIEQNTNTEPIFLGNVFKTSLKKIWNNSNYQNLRISIMNTNFPKECGNCLVKHGIICAGQVTNSK